MRKKMARQYCRELVSRYQNEYTAAVKSSLDYHRLFDFQFLPDSLTFLSQLIDFPRWFYRLEKRNKPALYETFGDGYEHIPMSF